MAQLGARLNGIQKVSGSIPLGSTNKVQLSSKARGISVPGLAAGCSPLARVSSALPVGLVTEAIKQGVGLAVLHLRHVEAHVAHVAAGLDLDDR